MRHEQIKRLFGDLGSESTQEQDYNIMGEQQRDYIEERLLQYFSIEFKALLRINFDDVKSLIMRNKQYYYLLTE